MDVLALTGAHEPRNPQQQGRKANNNGRYFEQLISQSLRSRGYVECRVAPNPARSPFFVPQCTGLFESIYGIPMRVDFYVWHPDKFPQGLIIECKYQETNGSADEKFPYTVANLKKAGIPTILLLIGDGAKRKAVDWCARQQSTLLTVFVSVEAFLRRLNGGLL